MKRLREFGYAAIILIYTLYCCIELFVLECFFTLGKAKCLHLIQFATACAGIKTNSLPNNA